MHPTSQTPHCLRLVLWSSQTLILSITWILPIISQKNTVSYFFFLPTNDHAIYFLHFTEKNLRWFLKSCIIHQDIHFFNFLCFGVGVIRFVCLFIMDSTGVWTQDLVQAKHTLHHWAIPSPRQTLEMDEEDRTKWEGKHELGVVTCPVCAVLLCQRKTLAFLPQPRAVASPVRPVRM